MFFYVTVVFMVESWVSIVIFYVGLFMANSMNVSGERLIQFATENLVTEVLIHPQVIFKKKLFLLSRFLYIIAILSSQRMKCRQILFLLYWKMEIKL